MSKVKFTDRWIASVTPPQSGRVELSDAICPGLYLRVSSKGVKTFSVIYRHEVVMRRTLGRYPVLSLADARRSTMQILREAAELPARGSKAALPTFAEIAASYLELHLKRNCRDWKGVNAYLQHPRLAHLHSKRASQIEKREILTVLDAIVEAGTPHSAVNMLKYLKACFNWAITRDLLVANPCAGIKPPVRTTERDHILSGAELASVYRAATALQPPAAGAMVRMLALTGQRLREVSEMRWEEIEGDTWVIPRERVKKDRAHAVPLSAVVMSLLGTLPKPAGDKGFVFSNDGGTTSTSNFSKMKRKLDGVSGVSGWKLHDLRRTAASGMAALGVTQQVIRKLLNHEEGRIDRTYNRHDYLAEKREALKQWGMRVMSLHL